MTVSIADICDAITSALSAATGLSVAQSFDALGEGINDAPLLQVYPDAGEQDPSGQTERTTFGAGVRQTSLTVLADLYAKQRAFLAEDMGKLVGMVDAITNVLEQQDSTPPFGLAGIQDFKWSWRRVVFQYGDPDIKYIGARFTLIMRIF